MYLNIPLLFNETNTIVSIIYLFSDSSSHCHRRSRYVILFVIFFILLLNRCIILCISDFSVVLNTSPIRILGDDISGPHSTAITVGRKTVLACAHSLELVPDPDKSDKRRLIFLKYVEDYWIQERVTKDVKGKCVDENCVALKLYKFHVDNDWALFERSDGNLFDESEIAHIDENLITEPTISYLRGSATVLHCPVALFATFKKAGEHSIGCEQHNIRIQGQSAHHLKYEGRDLTRGSSGGGIFMTPSNRLLGMHMEALLETEFEVPDVLTATQIAHTNKKSNSGEVDPYPKIEDSATPPSKKVKCDSDTVASLAGGNNGRGSALIICKFPYTCT
jgi:hypothetical protein